MTTRRRPRGEGASPSASASSTGPRSSLTLVVGIAMAAGVCGLVAILTVASGAPRIPEHAVTTRPLQVTGNGYVSSDACKACHPSEYASWHRSYHRTMTQVATPDSVIPVIDGSDGVDRVEVPEVPGRPMTLERRGHEMWATLDDPDWKRPGTASESADTIDSGLAAPRIERQVVMMTGSHHQQVYWYSTGHDRPLGQLPAEYLVAERRWIPRSTALMHPPGPAFSQTGSWNTTCIACHTTQGKPGLTAPMNITTGVASQAVEFGIACESCHGPGEEHVRLNRNPLRRYGLHLTRSGDESTTLPTQLNTARSSQVCGQCHSVWEFYDTDGEQQANRNGLPYRPGRELLDTRLVVQRPRGTPSPAMSRLIATDPQFIRDSFWPDGMIRVSGREYNGLIESPCFRDAKDEARTLSCFSCHDMHQAADDNRPTGDWANGQLAPKMESNTACLQCHPSFAANLSAHTKHGASSAGSSCYNCHMPYTTYGLLRTLRSHQISTPSVDVSVRTGRPNACNLCHLDKTLQWTADTLQQWYGTPVPALGADEQTIAASLLWLLRGDAGQRAIVAQSMSWPPAQQASGVGWMAPHLARLVDDPYEALRFIVFRSLRSLPGFERFADAYNANQSARVAAGAEAIRLWKENLASGSPRDPRLLIGADGAVMAETVSRLIQSRDNRPLYLRE